MATPSRSPTDSELADFRTWLLEAGRTEGTAKLYVTNVRSCYAADGGVTARLIGDDLAPKTMRTNRAALMSFADFREDFELVKRLKKIRLPPAQRVTAKTPLETDRWTRMIQCVRAQHTIPPAHRAALLIICIRGLRCRDVLRLRRTDVLTAIRTGRLIGETKGRKRIEYAAAPLLEALEVLAEIQRWETVTDLLAGRSQAVGYKREESAARTLRRALARCADDAAVEGVHPHGMRRTYATHYVARIHNDPRALIKLQTHMGWSGIATAAGYVDAVQREELDALGEAMIAEVAGAAPAAPNPPRGKKRRA